MTEHVADGFDSSAAATIDMTGLPPVGAAILRASTRLPPRWPAAMPLALAAYAGVPRHVQLIPSLALGGAERIVADLMQAWSECGTRADVIVLGQAPFEHPVDDGGGVSLHRIGHLRFDERMAYAAGLILASGLPAYCHLTSTAALRKLWQHGCSTIPVVHNVADGWTIDPCDWNVDAVPFVVACGEIVGRALRASGLSRPVRVLRHQVPPPPRLSPERRRAVRAAFGADDTTLLIGMVGRIVPQKNHVRAVGVLSTLRSQGIDARLALIGPVFGVDAELASTALETAAARAGVRASLIRTGAIADAGRLVAAFDVVLNTSLREGVSVATMEAVAAGVPVVSADVGGQSEVLGPADRLLDATQPDADWAAAIVAVATAAPGGRRPPPARLRRTVAQLWPWWALQVAAPAPESNTVLFVTGDLDIGGAQRSLCNLATALPCRGLHTVVAVSGPVGVPALAVSPTQAGARVVSIAPAGTELPARLDRLMALIAETRPATVVFWNLDPALKFAASRALEGSLQRIAEVSPGPDLFTALARDADIGRVLGIDAGRYLQSLDGFVAKYRDGLPAQARPRHLAVIPNGVPESKPLPQDEGPAPDPFDPRLAVVTVGRLHPSKRPDLWPRLASALAQRVPGASLHIVGAVHPDAGGQPGKRGAEAWRMLIDAAGGAWPSNLVLAGPDLRSSGFLARFAAFYMVSTGQGCPNASLEAMSCGLPVVANPDGGTAEQVEHGVTGLLVADPGDPDRYADLLADALATVLTDPERASAMGAAARDRVQREFSMARMADTYAAFIRGLHADDSSREDSTCSTF